MANKSGVMFQSIVTSVAGDRNGGSFLPPNGRIKVAKMDLKTVVAAKFAHDEKITALLTDAALVGPSWLRRERIVVLVQCGNLSALFVLLSVCFPPKSFLDLSIETILPIDDTFECELGNVPVLLHLIVASRGSRISFELKPGTDTAVFVDLLFRSMDGAAGGAFPWLDKYGRNKSADADSSVVFVSRQNIAQGIAPIAFRENMIKYQMELKESEYIFAQPYNMFIGTWNVNGQPPLIALKQWLIPDYPMPPDIYVIGFQELDLSKETLLFDTTIRESEWYKAVLKGLDSRVSYEKVAIVRLVGIMLIVLVNKQHSGYIRNVATDTVGTGLMGKMGNKGGVSIRFDLHNTSICFVNSHLAAHVEEFERRNQDYQDICSRMRFTQMMPPKYIKDHEQIYWLGDLNYRITNLDHITVKKLLDESNIEAVLVADQLKAQHSANNVFQGYKEGPITFQPTYKYDPGTDLWDSSEKERAPAWCDRIFWKGVGIKQTSYRSHPELNISDHKPVSATFMAEIKVINLKKYRKVHKEVIKKLDKLENEFLPHVTVEPTEIEFDTVKYLELKSREVCIANTGQVPVTFEFIKKLEESSYCRQWLNVEPNVKSINPGEKCDVKLEIFVNKDSAFKLNKGEDKLYDILVLHLEGGKDIFITVIGQYEKSCFGSSMETLIHLKAPIYAARYQDASIDDLYYKRNGYHIPKEIWFLVDFIYRRGLNKSNLFNRPGLHSELLLIRDWLDCGSSSEIPGSVHSVVNALILFLESTAEPVIPYEVQYKCFSSYNDYLQCKQIVMDLSDCNKNVFFYICAFLREVLYHSGDNGTDVKTLSLLFGTVFLRDPPQDKKKTTNSKRSDNKKKAAFVEHFLVRDQHDELKVE